MTRHTEKQERQQNIPVNILTLRRRLMMTQQEFLNACLSENGTPLVSVATLSNIERGSTANVDRLSAKLAETMSVSREVFEMDPDAFAKSVGLFFSHQLEQGKERMAGRISEARRTNTVESLARALCDYIMDSLISGKLATGGILPSDRQLGAMFGVGRTPIREALKALNVLGLLQIFPGKGTFIASQTTDLFFAPLSWSFLLGQSTTDQIIDVRNILEAESARLAALNATPERLTELARIFDSMTEAYNQNNFQTFLDMDIDFHLAVAKCSANPIILNLLTTSRKLLTFISKSGINDVAGIRSIYKEHHALFEAIRKTDPDQAHKAMQKHLHAARKRYSLRAC